MNIAIYAVGVSCHNGLGMEFLRNKPLGGTEHVFLTLIEKLREKKHDVSLIMDKADQRVPYYFTRTEYLKNHNDADVLICVNFIPDNLLEYKTNKKMWFAHQPGFMNAQKWQEEFDLTVAISPHHKGVLQRMGWRGRIEVIGYGFNPEDFPVHEYKNKKRLIYHSVPNRGLQKLIDWLPDLIAIEPEIELVLCSDWTIYYDSYNKDSDLVIPQDHHVIHAGAVGFSELLEWLNSSYIHAYPAVYNDETFCYSALFSQAAGLPIVTTKVGALQDTASGQILLRGPVDDIYKKRFLEQVDKLLHDKNYWDIYHMRALKKASYFTWDKIINYWEILLKELS